MTADEVFEQFSALDEREREAFMSKLALWCDLNLPDGKYLVIGAAYYSQLVHGGRRAK
jgi:hypothetical protein